MDPLPKREKKTRRELRRRERKREFEERTREFEERNRDVEERTIEEEEEEEKTRGYEYLPHTADVQLHAWGTSIEEAFECVTVAMFGYMTEIEKVETKRKKIVVTKGTTDLKSLLYKLMDEFLYLFCTEGFTARELRILELDRKNLTIRAEGFGETFDLKKHPQGTEVKAITYSAMQIHEKFDRVDVFVVIDI
eukprot:g6572.t1